MPYCKNNIIASCLILLFVLLNIGNVEGQVIRLKKSTGDGGTPPDNIVEAPPCISDNASTIELLVQNLWDDTIVISSVHLNSNPSGIFLDETVEVSATIPSMGYYSFVFDLSENWTSLLLGDVFFANYTFTYQVLNEEEGVVPTPSESVVEDFRIRYIVCSKTSEPELPIERLVSSMPFLYPNPTKGNYSLSYSLSEMSSVSISLYTSIGEEVESVLNKEKHEQGAFSIKGNIPEHLPNGVYYIVTKMNAEVSMQRLLKI